jgi:L-threonylcarbamoyladenylate synthase
MTNEYKKIIEVLSSGGVAVIPTDTIYGLVGQAHTRATVERIYTLKERDEGKPCIILITRLKQMEDFGVVISSTQKEFLSRVWPGKVSVVVSCTKKSFHYLHRGTETVAFRMIGTRMKNLHTLIETVGPLVAPSANPQGLPPARNRREARAYFGERVDGYVCVGVREGLPSTVVSFQDGNVTVLRKGAVKVK